MLAARPQSFHLYDGFTLGVTRRAQEKDPRTVIRLPIELLSWAGGEPVMGTASLPDLTSEVIRKACQPPAQRFDTINKITGSKRPMMDLELDRHLVEVTGRTLPPMELIYYDNYARRPTSVNVEAEKVAPAASARASPAASARASPAPAPAVPSANGLPNLPLLSGLVEPPRPGWEGLGLHAGGKCD